MIHNKSVDSNLVSIIGYGTFITRNLWKDKFNVEVCLVKNFTRVFPKNSWFPYALPSNNSFWALKFDVNQQELELLDSIEGVFDDLFERLITEVYLKNNKIFSAYIYIPTKKTIASQKLSLELDKNDQWKEEIKKYPEIVEKFPKLVL